MFYEKKVEDNEINVGITTEARESDVPKASGDELPSPDDNNDNEKMPGLVDRETADATAVDELLGKEDESEA
eukprot:8114040-Ditylum_brightwellii.AAC.1